jgi:hypothetical protein
MVSSEIARHWGAMGTCERLMRDPAVIGFGSRLRRACTAHGEGPASNGGAPLSGAG